MGAGITLHQGDSLVSPGKRSVISDPIDCNYDAFLDEVCVLLKYPIPPHLEALLKEVKVTDGCSPDEFEVLVVLSADKLQKYGFANQTDPSLDRIHSHVKTTVDRKARKLVTEHWKQRWQGEEPEPSMKAFTEFTKDPMRIDYHWELADGTRVADKAPLQALSPIVNAAFSALSERKIIVKLDKGKRVFTCDPVDDSVVSYEPFFDGLISVMKEASKDVQELTESKLKLIPYSPEMPYSTVFFSKDSGTITQDIFTSDGSTKLSRTYYSVSRSPVTFEIYSETESETRLLGFGQQRILQNLVDAAVLKASSAGWGFGFF